MLASKGKSLSLLVCCLVAALLTGCAGRTESGWNYSFFMPPPAADGGPPPENLVTPAKRINDLRALAASAHKGDLAEQERISTTLAEATRTELDPLVRAQVVRTLGVYKTATARTALAVCLQDSTADVRTAACEALGKNGGPDAVRLLSDTVANDTDFDVRMAAVRSLGESGDATAVGGLGAALEDPNPAMQRRAMESLARATGRSYGNDVNAWRLYVQGQEPVVQPVSIAERFRRLF